MQRLLSFRCIILSSNFQERQKRHSICTLILSLKDTFTFLLVAFKIRNSLQPDRTAVSSVPG